jgi:hypothetical protein
MNLKKLADQAKKVVDKRGGTDALKADLSELQTIAKGKGSASEKAKAAAAALKQPGAKGDAAPEAPAAPKSPPPAA